MALGNDDVIEDDGSAGVAALTVGGPGTEAHPRAGGHFRNSRLWPRHKPLGRPRVSTLVLMSTWIVVLALYLEVRPG